MIKILKNDDGFTLIELIVSIAILSFVLVGFLNLFVNSATYLVFARQKNNTSVEAQNLVDGSIGSGSPVAATISSTVTTTSTTLELHFNKKSETMENVTLVTVTGNDGNQSSTITTLLP